MYNTAPFSELTFTQTHEKTPDSISLSPHCLDKALVLTAKPTTDTIYSSDETLWKCPSKAHYKFRIKRKSRLRIKQKSWLKKCRHYPCRQLAKILARPVTPHNTTQYLSRFNRVFYKDTVIHRPEEFPCNSMLGSIIIDDINNFEAEVIKGTGTS